MLLLEGLDDDLTSSLIEKRRYSLAAHDHRVPCMDPIRLRFQALSSQAAKITGNENDRWKEE